MAELSDCTIVCGGTAFRVHKGIIARCSSVFARMWTKGFKVRPACLSQARSMVDSP